MIDRVQNKKRGLSQKHVCEQQNNNLDKPKNYLILYLIHPSFRKLKKIKTNFKLSEKEKVSPKFKHYPLKVRQTLGLRPGMITMCLCFFNKIEKCFKHKVFPTKNVLLIIFRYYYLFFNSFKKGYLFNKFNLITSLVDVKHRWSIFRVRRYRIYIILKKNARIPFAWLKSIGKLNFWMNWNESMKLKIHQ